MRFTAQLNMLFRDRMRIYPRKRASAVALLVVSAALTCLGLLSPGAVSRAELEPNRYFDSEYLLARGFPFDWFIVETPYYVPLSLSESILPRYLLTDYLLSAVAVYAIWSLGCLLYLRVKRIAQRGCSGPS
jgi:hypothetical protein